MDTDLDIDLPEIARDVRRFLDANEMYLEAKRFFTSRLFRVDPDDVCALDPWIDEDTKKTTNEKVRYELREAQVYFSEGGLVGKCSQRQFQGVVHFSYDHEVKRLSSEQPGCEWQLIAVSIQRVNLAQTVEIDHDGPRTGIGKMGDFYDSPDSVAIEQKIAHSQVPDYRLVCHLVFCDVAHGELGDPATYHAEGKEGPMTRYSRTRLLRHLTDGQRKTRKVVTRQVQEFYHRQDRRREQLEAQAIDAPLASREEVALLLGRIAKLEAEQRALRTAATDAMQPVLPPPRRRASKAVEAEAEPPPIRDLEVAIPEVKPIADDLAEKILEMRVSGQMTPKSIAAAIVAGGVGITEDEVKGVLRARSA